ncbi:MAG: MFS transporter [Ruminococcaceae bacterium]|nr:MFS transporter [Oscillospiraceae bacterium]
MSDRKVRGLALLFMATYMVSYITRVNFGAVISEIEADTHIARTLLSMSITGSFITYGAGQLISGVCGDLVSPKRLVQAGLITTTLMNLIIPLCQSPYQMLVVWCINGFAQAFMWPPIVKLMVAAFSEEYYNKMAIRISCASSYGTIVTYFAAPLLISAAGWRAVFIFAACCGAIMTVLWSKYCIDIKSIVQKPLKREEIKKPSAVKVLFSPVVIAVMFAIILQGMLRDGVTTWMPTYITDTYNLGTTVSILSGVVIPLFSILCIKIASALYKGKLQNPVLCSAVMFLIGLISAVALYFSSGSSVILSVVCTSVLTGAMYGVATMLTAIVPPFFKKYGNISTVSGVLNACTYVGSGISTFGIAVLSKNMGWKLTLLMWCVVAVMGTILCFVSAIPWKKKFSESD